MPGVNHLGTYGRWAFAEFTDIYAIQTDFAAAVEQHFTSGTIMHDSHLPLRKWFVAIYLMCESKKGILGAAVEADAGRRLPDGLVLEPPHP